MQNIAIREAAPGDFESICALNLAEGAAHQSNGRRAPAGP